MHSRHFFALLLPFLFAETLYGNFEDHLKKPSVKAKTHQMRNIDFIYVINLDQRPEKFASCVQQLAPYTIDPFRFSAVNGWELSFEQINDVGIKFGPWMESGKWGTFYLSEQDPVPHHEMVSVEGRTYFSHCMSLGAIGIVLSHLSVINDAYQSGYETIWVMEDDIEVIRNPHLLSDYIDQLDALAGVKGWDILFTDQDTKNNQGSYVPCTAYAWRPNYTPANPHQFYLRQDLAPHIRQIGARYGAYSMIIRRSGMKKLLDFFKRYDIFLPYDMEYAFPSDIRLFTITQDVVSTQIHALSDNGAPNYKKNFP